MKKDFLVELGTEELPPKALRKLGLAFCQGVEDGIRKSELEFRNIKWFASPRRLALLVEDIDVKQQDKTIEKRGPALTAAFKEDGCPSPAAEGFARSVGTTVDQLEKLETNKGAWLTYRVAQPGQAAAILLPEIVAHSLKNLPVPKRMRWADNDFEFVRPAHWLVMMLGEDAIDCVLYGHKAGKQTFGHRFHHPEAITIPTANEYEQLLFSQGKVIPDYEQRRLTIKAQVEEAALNIEGQAQVDEALLDEVTGLVEWPVAIVGRFEEHFLNVPSEALISAMKGHQKYFHVLDQQKKLKPYFITVSNIDSKKPDTVREGNERVIRPRLSDAEFFWEQDKKIPFIEFRKRLGSVVFQHQLGTVLDKTERVEKLANFIADSINKTADDVTRAARLSKCDLMTEMVGEFPELQGTMGRYYALNSGEVESVAAAIEEQYMPRFAGDAIPSSFVGAILSIAERIDTLVGIFGIGQTPSGDKDPFALRRAALGVLRTIIESDLSIDLKSTIEQSVQLYAEVSLEPKTNEHVYQFMMDRLKNYYQDMGIDIDVFESVVSVEPRLPTDMHNRIKAIAQFKVKPEANSLAAANKRIKNILRKLDKPLTASVNDTLFVEEAERKLYSNLVEVRKRSEKYLEDQQYQGALDHLAELREDVDDFFDHVMVMVDDPALQENRLALLNALSGEFLKIADISQLQIK